jgi:hypothetical protein
MFNIKSSLQRIFDWDGWRWVCYLSKIVMAVYVLLIICDMFSARYHPNYPIGSECCGWSYKTLKNKIIWSLFDISIIVAFYFLSQSKKSYFYRFFVISFGIFFSIFLNAKII